MNWRYGRTILLGLSACLLLAYCAVSVFGVNASAVLQSLLMSVAWLAGVILTAALVVAIARWLRARCRRSRLFRGSEQRLAGDD